MAKNMEIALLYDAYGDMLTDKQRDMFEQYYNQDLSLAEIAENTGISRQAVRDTVKRAEMQLSDMEEHIGMVAKLKEVRSSLESISECANAIYREAAATDSKEIEDRIGHLILLAETLTDKLM